jgi:uncharacterized coiled-coil protein SlyX
MSRIKSLQAWLDWLYPLRFFSILIIMGFIHFVLWLHVDAPSRPLVHKFIAFVGQVGGAAIIFYTINGTLNTFKGISLSGMISEWWKNAPWHPDRIFDLEVHCGITANTTVDVVLVPEFTSLEQRVEFIHNRLDKLNTELGKQEREMNKKIETVRHDLGDKIKKSYSSFETKLTQTVKEELFHQQCGFMMLIYGVITSLAL